MPDPRPRTYVLRHREGAPRGDLYELSQTFWTDVVDTRSDQVVMTFETRMEATLGRESGTWEQDHWTGAREILIAEDDRAVSVIGYDGRVEVFPLSPD